MFLNCRQVSRVYLESIEVKYDIAAIFWFSERIIEPVTFPKKPPKAPLLRHSARLHFNFQFFLHLLIYETGVPGSILPPERPGAALISTKLTDNFTISSSH